jgi:hypothetical protein
LQQEAPKQQIVRAMNHLTSPATSAQALNINLQASMKGNNPIEDLLETYTQRTDTLIKDWEESLQGSDTQQHLSTHETRKTLH